MTVSGVPSQAVRNICPWLSVRATVPCQAGRAAGLALMWRHPCHSCHSRVLPLLRPTLRVRTTHRSADRFLNVQIENTTAHFSSMVKTSLAPPLTENSRLLSVSISSYQVVSTQAKYSLIRLLPVTAYQVSVSLLAFPGSSSSYR